jgi:hypothetical protein
LATLDILVGNAHPTWLHRQFEIPKREFIVFGELMVGSIMDDRTNIIFLYAARKPV